MWICVQAPTLRKVQSELILPSSKWTNQTNDPQTELKLCKLGERTASSSVEGVVILTLVIKSDCYWVLNVHGRNVTSSQCSAISHFPLIVMPENVNSILQDLDTLAVCPGHPDQHLVQMAKEKKSLRDGHTSATLDECADVSLNGEIYCCTLHAVSCEMLIPSGKCSACVSSRATLQKMYNCWQKNVASTPTRHTNTSSRPIFGISQHHKRENEWVH